MSESPDFDAQDNAEAFDETMFDEAEGVGEMRTFEELPDVFDMTQAVGDRHDDDAVAVDADRFSEEMFTEDDLEEDDELNPHAATAEREDEIDGLGGEAGSGGFDEAAIGSDEIDGLEVVRDADAAEGGEDDFTDFQARDVSDADLQRMGYAETRGGRTVARKD